MLIAKPSLAKDNEGRTASGLFIASEQPLQAPVIRGVIVDIGDHVAEPNAEIGGVVHYQAYVPIGIGGEELHVVGHADALAFEAA